MAKQAKPKVGKTRNDNRPNGKAWKRSHGSNPPVEQAKADHETSRRRAVIKPGKRK